MKFANKSLAYLLSGAALLTLSTGAFAFGGHHGRHGDCDHNSALRAVYALPDLTDAQRTKLDTLRKEERSRMRANFDAMRDSRRKLHDALADNADKATIQPLAQKQGELVSAMIMERVEARDQVEAILTAKQREKLKSRLGEGFGGPMSR